MNQAVGSLCNLGIAWDDACALRRVAMVLHRWHELECGIESGGLDQDETTGKWWWYNSRLGKRTHVVPDREKGALRRLAGIMARYPTLQTYVQGDPRGAALYIIRSGDVPEGKDVAGYYSRGICVY